MVASSHDYQIALFFGFQNKCESCWLINKNAKSAAAGVSNILASIFFLKMFQTHSKLKIKYNNESVLEKEMISDAKDK